MYGHGSSEFKPMESNNPASREVAKTLKRILVEVGRRPKVDQLLTFISSL